MDLPRGYEPFKINTVANDAVAGILCRRPDGGVSDFRVVLPNPTTYGVCPSCGRDMKKHNASTFSCSAGHVLVVMTSGEAPTRRTAQRKQRRTIRNVRKSGAFPPVSSTRTIAQSKSMTDEDVRAVVDAAMKEAFF